MQKMKQKKGITLIALVITIIVLLILAGVTIQLTLGEHGILTKAQIASKVTTNANLEEQINLAVLTARMNNLGGRIDTEILEEELGKLEVTGSMVEKQGVEGALPWIVTIGEYKFKIKEDGSVEAVNGIILSSENLKMVEGQEPVTLTATLTNGITGTVEWSSSDTSVVTVENGVITLVGSTGTADVTAKISGTEYSATCKVTIVSKVTTITVENIEIEQGKSGKLTVTTSPSTNIEDLEYISNNTKVTVDKEGKVTVAKDAEISLTATITVKGKISGKTSECTVTVIAPKGLQVGDYVEYDVTYKDVCSGYEFTATNGWRVLDVGKWDANAKEASGATLVSTGIPARLYYYKGNVKNFEKDAVGTKGKWAGNSTDRENYATNFYASSSNDNENMYAAAGLYYNFGKIKFSCGTTSNGNEGCYTKVNRKEEGELEEDEFIVEGKASGVHNLTLAELNKALGNSDLTSSSISTSNNLFYLRGLTNFDYTNSSSCSYWLAAPIVGNTGLLRYVSGNGNISSTTFGSYGVRPVVSLTSSIYKENGVWKIK